MGLLLDLPGDTEYEQIARHPLRRVGAIESSPFGAQGVVVHLRERPELDGHCVVRAGVTASTACARRASGGVDFRNRHGLRPARCEPIGLPARRRFQANGEAPRPEPTQRTVDRVFLPTRRIDKFVDRCAGFSSEPVQNQAELAAGAFGPIRFPSARRGALLLRTGARSRFVGGSLGQRVGAASVTGVSDENRPGKTQPGPDLGSD